MCIKDNLDQVTKVSVIQMRFFQLLTQDTNPKTPKFLLNTEVNSTYLFQNGSLGPKSNDPKLRIQTI